MEQFKFQRVEFQFTPLREGRLKLLLRHFPAAKRFNSRPCVRGDSVEKCTRVLAFCFNSRPCVRGDQRMFDYQEAAEQFQFTPLREGRRAR